MCPGPKVGVSPSQKSLKSLCVSCLYRIRRGTVEAVVGLEELAHMPNTGRLQIGQQSRNEGAERHAKDFAGGTANRLLQVTPSRLDALRVVIARVAGRCIGVVAALAAPVPLEPRRCAILPDGAQPVDNLLLDPGSPPPTPWYAHRAALSRP
jgi:hypothetical protein